MATWRRGDVILDLYEVLDVVRTGGLGLVHRVHHRGWDIDLAVKTPRPAVVRSPDGIGDFEREAEVWVGLGLHPHIVNCVYVRTLEAVPRVFAEWADGGSLAEAVRNRTLYGDDPLATLLDVAIQSAWGLDHAHENDVVHQDVKPANVMLTRDGTVKVTDFGLARARTAGDAEPFVSRGGLDPAYCSPEQARSPSGLTPATDVWSWAVTVFEMLLGEPPVRDGTTAGDAFEDYTRSATRGAIGRVPVQMLDVLRECFAKNPAARPPRLGPLAERLVEVHRREVGPYHRHAPSAATLLADSLSNHALSMLDLGRHDSAEELWTRALRADPHHPHTRYNRGLHRWRTGVITDAELVDELESLRFGDPEDSTYLLALVHRERGDAPAAAELLRGAYARMPHDQQIAAALASVRDAPAPAQSVLPGEHDDWIAALALTPDGTTGISADGSGGLRIWDLVTGECRQELRLDNYRASTLAVRDDGRVLVVGGGTGRALVLDLEAATGFELPGHPSWVLAVALTQDQRHAVTSGYEGEVVTWDLETGEAVEVRQFESKVDFLGARGTLCCAVDHARRTSSVYDVRTGALVHRFDHACLSVRFTDDGRLVAVTGGSIDVRLIDLGSGGAPRVLRTGYGRTALNTDGTVGFSSGGRAEPSRVWELTTGRCRLSLGAAPDTREVALSATGHRALTAEGKTVRLWHLPPVGPPAPWSYVRPHQARDVTAAATRAAELLDHAATHGAAGRLEEAAELIRAARALPGHRRHTEPVRLWRRLGALGRRTALVDAWSAGRITPAADRSWALTLSGRSPTVLARAHNSEAWVFDVETGQLLHTLSLHTGHLSALAMTADGRLAVSGGEDGRIVAWQPRDRRIVQLFTSPRDHVYYVAVSEDGQAALSGTADGVVAAWDIPSGRSLGRWEAHPGAVLDVAVSADHRYGLSRGQDVTVKIWDLRTGELRWVLEGHEEWIGAARLSQDGRYVVTGGSDATVRLWRTADGQCEAVLTGHTDAVVDVLPGEDGRHLLSCSADGTVRLWDAAAARCVHVLTGHTAAVRSLAVTPDFRLAASGGEDRQALLWDLTAGRQLRAFTGFSDAVTDVALAPDGALLLAGDERGRLLTWALDWEYDFGSATGVLRAESEPVIEELRAEVAVELPSRDDSRPALVEAMARIGEPQRRAVTRTLELAAELDKIPSRNDTGYRLYMHFVAEDLASRDPDETPGTAEALTLLLRPQEELNRTESFWANHFAHQLQDDLVTLAEAAPLLHSEGDPVAAERTWQLVVDVRSHLWDAGHVETQRAMLGWASVLIDLHRQTEALALIRAVTAERERDLGPDHPATLEAIAALASLLTDQGELNKAERMYDVLVPQLVRRRGPDDLQTLEARVGLARVHRRLGRHHDAAQALREVLAKRRLRLGEHHPDTLAVQAELDSLPGSVPPGPKRRGWRRGR
ncbi:protein kinase domain-containing protein [Streptomyces sp. enrichment culture]|uniref:WD40 repeat domain-containing serine/threonine protein kinase n=1 Tax=Streptomyces sp. enrichment culture TaxID=1795815 RepID=UPI003F55D84B